MSLVNDNRKHSKTVITAANKAKLHLSRRLVDKVHATHAIVKEGTEWSGILKYKVISGNVENPETLEIECLDFLLMDIGSAAYTEYDFETSDSELIEFIMNTSLEGCKYGHKCYVPLSSNA